MRRKETSGHPEFLKRVWRGTVAGLLGLTLLMSADQGTTNAQSVPEDRNVSGATKATEEEASFTVWIEHQAEGYMLRCSGVQLFSYLIVSASHCVEDGQDHLFNTDSTSIYFPTAPERGAVHPIRIFHLFYDVTLFFIGTQPAGNVTTIPLADEVSNFSEKNLKVIGSGGDGETSFTKWPNTGPVEITEDCVNSKNYLPVTTRAGLNLQVEGGDSGGALYEESEVIDSVSRSLVGISSKYCADETSDGLTPVKYSQVNIDPNRKAISDTIKLIQDNTFTMPPTTKTLLLLNGTVARWDTVNVVDIEDDQTQSLEYIVDQENPTGQSSMSLTFGETAIQDLPECVTFQGALEPGEFVLENGVNPLHSYTVEANCEAIGLKPYEPLSFIISSNNTMHKSFMGPNGIETITGGDVLYTRVNVHNSIELNANTLSEEPTVIYDDNAVEISSTVSSDLITFSVESRLRPLKISVVLTQGNRTSERIKVAIPWTIAEREMPGALLQRSATLNQSEIFPPISQPPLYIPLLSK